MVKNGAGINEVESDTKFTPMHCACYMGALEVSRMFGPSTVIGNTDIMKPMAAQLSLSYF